VPPHPRSRHAGLGTRHGPFCIKLVRPVGGPSTDAIARTCPSDSFTTSPDSDAVAPVNGYDRVFGIHRLEELGDLHGWLVQGMRITSERTPTSWSNSALPSVVSRMRFVAAAVATAELNCRKEGLHRPFFLRRGRQFGAEIPRPALRRGAAGRAGAAPESTRRRDQRIPPGRVSYFMNLQVRDYFLHFESVQGGVRRADPAAARRAARVPARYARHGTALAPAAGAVEVAPGPGPDRTGRPPISGEAGPDRPARAREPHLGSHADPGRAASSGTSRGCGQIPAAPARKSHRSSVDRSPCRRRGSR
jgi:hypothetical protein